MMFLVFVLAQDSSAAAVLKGACGGVLNRVKERITDREIAEGNYCYFTIKLYTQAGITPWQGQT